MLDAHRPYRCKGDLSRPALKVFFAICEKWRLTSQQAQKLLGSPSRSTFYRWRRDRTGVLTPQVLERISYVLGIYRALNQLFATPAQADGWIRRSNTGALFAGGSALNLIMSGKVADLAAVRQYLDAQCGWT